MLHRIMDETDILARLDHPAVNSGIFFPRSDSGRDAPAGSEDLEIEVSGGDRIAARYHRAPDGQVTILHFHGNGEIVADYDDLVPLFHGCGASVTWPSGARW